MIALFLIINLINLILIFFMIICEHKHLHRVAIWLLVFALLPIIGFLIYLILGTSVINAKKKLIKITDKSLLNKKNLRENYFSIKGNFSDIEKFNLINANSLVLNNEYVKVFSYGNEFFNDLRKTLKTANNFIMIFSYIFADDNIGKEVLKVLEKKAEEGVKVIVVYDSFGSKKNDKDFFKNLIELGAIVKEFFPPLLKNKLLQLSINYRNHRKICIIDGDISYIGGLNIRDDHLGRDDNLKPWRDTHIKIKGNTTLVLMQTFLDDLKLCDEKINTSLNNITGKIYKENAIQVVNSSPLESGENIEESFIKLINLSKKKIIIETPYLILDDKFLNALKLAKLSGKEVVIFIPKIFDKAFVYNATLFYAQKLLDMGVEVLLYNGFIHSKCLIVDDEVFVCGSCNFDMRSFYLNFETSVIIYENKVVKEYLKQVNKDRENSENLTLNYYKKLPIFKRLAIRFCSLFSPIL